MSGPFTLDIETKGSPLDLGETGAKSTRLKAMSRCRRGPAIAALPSSRSARAGQTARRAGLAEPEAGGARVARESRSRARTIPVAHAQARASTSGPPLSQAAAADRRTVRTNLATQEGSWFIWLGVHLVRFGGAAGRRGGRSAAEAGRVHEMGVGGGTRPR